MALVLRLTLRIALHVEIHICLLIMAYAFKVDKENSVYKVEINHIIIFCRPEAR